MYTGRLTGFWWLPETPGHLVGGALYLEWDERPRLEVFGQLEGVDMQGALGQIGKDMIYPIVHGQATDGRAVTLWDAKVGSSQLLLLDPQHAYLEIRATRAIIGVHVPARDSGFRQVRVGVEHMLDWLEAPLVQRSYETENGRWIGFQHGWRKTTPIDCHIGGARVQMSVSAREVGDRVHKSSIEQWAEVVIDPSEPATADEIHARYVVPLANLLTFVTGRAAAVDYVGLVAADLEGEHESELLWKRRAPRDPSPRPLMPDDLLFTASALPTTVGSVLERWFDLSADLEDVMNLFLGTRYAAAMFEQNRFLNLAQAAEALHRAQVGDRRQLTDDERARRDAILRGSPEEHESWLAGLLDDDARIHFADRIRDFLAWDPWLVPEVIPNAPRFVRKLTDARNFHTHWDRTSTPRAPEGFDLWALNEMLIVILEARILDRLGFGLGERQARIAAGSAAYRALKLNPDAVGKVRR